MADPLPLAWLPDARMTGIICHWTAGAHRANATDRKHYHIIVEGDGNLVRGNHPISDNDSTADGDYAAHTLNCNTGFIGISMACMGGDGVRETPFSAGKFPMTIAQWQRMVEAVAQLCRRYRIAVTPKTVLSHAEVQVNLGKPQRGKWDFTRLAFDLSVVGAKACGDKLRREVVTAMSGMVKPTPIAQPLPTKPQPPAGGIVDTPLGETAGPEESRSTGLLGWLLGLGIVGTGAAVTYFWNPWGWW